MATTMKSLGSCRLHYGSFGNMSRRIFNRMSPMPSSSRTRQGNMPPPEDIIIAVYLIFDSISRGRSDAASILLYGVHHPCAFTGSGYRTSSAGLEKGWNEAGAASPASASSRRAAPKECGLSGSGLRTLAAVLALGGLTYLASASSVSAADLQDKLPHFHPLAADLNQLAESVSLSACPYSLPKDTCDTRLTMSWALYARTGMSIKLRLS